VQQRAQPGALQQARVFLELARRRAQPNQQAVQQVV
jgi:hypothetical protein